MKWANFLHLYQPADQVEEILRKVADESYRPLVQSLLEYPTIKITLNINGALSEQLEELGYHDIIAGLRTAAERGQIEFTGSAKYHALLPFLDENETVRQIQLNLETNQKIFGPAYNPKGFFPPEMGYAPSLAPLVEKLGYDWIIIDEIALNGHVNQVDGKTIYKIKGTNLMVYFRERLLSNLIMSALVRRKEDINVKEYDFEKKDYMITGMDGETFGHHRPGLQSLLTELMLSKDFQHVFFSELSPQIHRIKEASPVISTWASTEQEIEKGEQFLTWKDPQNQVHAWQWELQDLALKAVKNQHESAQEMQLSRHKLDQALASDQFFWASARPWWSLEIVEKGAWMLLDTIKSIPEIEQTTVEKAEDYYQKIITKIFEWQRTGHIRSIYKEYKETPRIPFKTKTKEGGEPWVYDAFLELMREAMKKAAAKENFEEATFWRDAIWKMETKNDIYDALHAVDLLRKQITNPQILDLIGKYRQVYERLSSGQPEQRQ